MDTSRFRDNLSDYLENRLSAAERGAMDAHLATSPDAKAELAALQTTWYAIDNWADAPVPDAPMFFRDNVMAAVERTGTRRGHWGTAPGVLERLFPNPGRLTFAAGIGGVVAVAGFLVATNVFLPTADAPQITTAGASLSRVASGLTLPYAGQVAENDIADVAPRFVVTTGRTLTPDARTACDFSFWLENAVTGSAKFTVLHGSGDTTGTPGNASHTFSYAGLSASAAQTLRVPLDTQKPVALAIKVRWTATGSAHERYLFVPTSPAVISEPAGGASPAPSFTLAEMPLLDALREVATATDTPITLEEVPNVETLRVRVAADGKESVSVAIRRALSPLGLRVSRSPAGVLVTVK